MMMVIMTQYWAFNLNHHHDMWYALPPNISGPEILGGRIHTYFCTPLLHWQCIGIALKESSTRGAKAKKETRNWWGLRNVSGEYLSEANDVGCGRRGSESWGLARFEVRHIRGMKEGSLNQKLRLFLSDRSVIQVPFTCARFPCFLVNFSICVKEHFIREEGSSSDFKSNIRTVTSPTVSTN